MQADGQACCVHAVCLPSATGRIPCSLCSLRAVQGGMPTAALAGLQVLALLLSSHIARLDELCSHASPALCRLSEVAACARRCCQSPVYNTHLASTPVQWLTLFWAVLRTPVFEVLCWTVMAPHVLRAALDAAATRRLPPHGRLAALGAGLACTGKPAQPPSAFEPLKGDRAAHSASSSAGTACG